MPATFSKPAKTARWADTGTRVEPSEAKKNTGWVFEEVPPFSFFNFLQGITGDWHQWIDERLFDGASIDDFVLKHPGTDTVALEIKSGRIELQGDANFALDLSGSNPQIQFFDDSLDAFTGNALIEFDRTSNQYEFYTSGTPGTSIVRIKKEGMEIRSGQSGVGGGLVVGGAQTLTKNFIYLGQDGTASAFSLQWKDSTDVRLNFVGTDDDFLKYDRSANELQLYIANTAEWKLGDGFMDANADWDFRRAGTTEMRLASAGLNILNGLVVGDLTTTPANDGLIVTGGLTVGTTTTPVADRIIVGNSNFYLDFNGTDPLINWDANDFFQYDRSANELILNIGSGRPMFKWDAVGTGSIRPEFELESFGTKARLDPIDNLYSIIRAPQDQPSFGDAPTGVKIQPTAQLVFDVGDTTDANGFSTYRIFRFQGGVLGGPNTVRTILALGQTWEIPFGAAGSENAPYIEGFDVQPLAGPITSGNFLELNANPISSGALACSGQLTFERADTRRLSPKFGSSGIYDIGESGAYYDDCYMDNYFGKSTVITAFDSYDDLALVDQYAPGPVELVEITKGSKKQLCQVGSRPTLPWPMLGPVCPDDGEAFISINDSILFLLGALKQMHAKHKSEVGHLREVIADLKGVDVAALLPMSLPQSGNLTTVQAIAKVAAEVGEDPLVYLKTDAYKAVDKNVTPDKPVILLGNGRHERLTEREANAGLWQGIVLHPTILRAFPIHESFAGDFVNPIRAYVKRLTMAGVPIWSGRTVRRNPC